jgi:hypothetical protein
MQSQETEIKIIRDYIQFSMVVIIFFSSLFYTALKATGVQETKAGIESLIWGIGIAFHIANYVAAGIIGQRVGNPWIRWIKVSLVVGMLAFIDPIIVGAMYSNAHLSALPANAFLISFYIAFTMPIATFTLFLAGAYWVMFKDLFLDVKKLLTRGKR